MIPGNPSLSADYEIDFPIPHVKIFCAICDRIEAFNPLRVDEYHGSGWSNSGVLLSKDRVQIFILSFQCQSCKGTPEVFLIRREGSKIILSGRTPIEHVDVPNVIPKEVKKFFSGAVVAHQSGQTLSGNFMFRCLIEQFTLPYADPSNSVVDVAIDAYMNSLPEDFRSRFPSLRALYSDLSLDIHTAIGDPMLFERAQKEIIEHFDARRLFKIQNRVA